MDRYLWRGNETLDIISKAHQKAQEDIQAAVDRIYAKMGKSYGLSKDEITKLLNEPAGRDEYERLLQEISTIMNATARKALEARASSGAYAYRVSRLDALKDHVRAQTARLADVELSSVTSHLRGIITDAYNRSMFDLQRGTGYGFSFAQMDTRTVNEILHNPWSGSNFSQRIWKAQDMLAKQLNEKLTAGFMSGRSNTQLSRELSDTMGVSFRNAERLVRTETNYMANAAEMRSYIEASIDKYEFMSTLDKRTSEVCQDLDGQVFLVKDAMPGKNMPPMHPHCRSTTVARFDDDALEGMQRRSKDPITGENVLVPRGMKYNDWLKMQEDTYGPERVELAIKMQANLSKDQKQYSDHLDQLGKMNVPDTFAKFQEMKYNGGEDWETFKAYSNAVIAGDISALTGLDHYKTVVEDVKTNLVGLTTSEGIKIKGFVYHYIDRTIGSYEQSREGVSVLDARYALIKPVNVKNTVRASGKSSALYIGGNCAVTVNPDTGYLIQTNPRR